MKIFIYTCQVSKSLPLSKFLSQFIYHTFPSNGIGSILYVTSRTKLKRWQLRKIIGTLKTFHPRSTCIQSGPHSIHLKLHPALADHNYKTTPTETNEWKDSKLSSCSRWRGISWKKNTNRHRAHEHNNIATTTTKAVQLKIHERCFPSLLPLC